MGGYFILQQVPRWGNQSDGRDRARMEGTHRGRHGMVRERDRRFQEREGRRAEGRDKRGLQLLQGRGWGGRPGAEGYAPRALLCPHPGGLRLNADAGG